VSRNNEAELDLVWKPKDPVEVGHKENDGMVEPFPPVDVSELRLSS